jgi:mono/diheme cytochrome c family protein
MRMRGWVLIWLFVGAGIFQGTVGAVKPNATSDVIAKGKILYERMCLYCHGADGRGDGPAAFFLGAYSAPRPMDFVKGGFKFRSTPSGELPTDQDLFRTLTRGIPGVMPPYAGLTEEERWQVIAYVKSFNPEFTQPPAQPIPLRGQPIPATAESIERGRAAYQTLACGRCHGADGRGDGPVALSGDLKDSRGFPIAPTDLTSPSSFKNGSSIQDIVRGLMTGLDGTPMPSYEPQFAGAEDDAWHLANYILSLSSDDGK